MRGFKNRLRYMVARRGWDPTVCAWELFGEANHAWVRAGNHRRLAPRAQQSYHADADRHPVFTHCHTGVGPRRNRLRPGQWLHPLPQQNPQPRHQLRTYLDEVAHYNKPVLVAEFGGRSELGAPNGDYLEAQLHSGIWASAMADFAGSAMVVVNFTDGIDGYRHY